MTLSDILIRDAIVPILNPVSKKQVFNDLARHIAALTDLSEHQIFEALLHREKLGSTGIGNGIAIPHTKFKSLKGLVGLFARLDKPIEFDALDDAPVDLIFVLLAPEGAGADHLKGLAKIARVLRDPNRLARLRATMDADMLFDILCDTDISKAA
jgi:nitrogen PTS system EIIA component